MFEERHKDGTTAHIDIEQQPQSVFFSHRSIVVLILDRHHLQKTTLPGKELTVYGTKEEPLFCLADMCKAVDLDASQVMKRLDDGVVSTEPIQDSLGRVQNANFVNEDGLYDVILDSRKPEAKAFRKWITSEVLPSIRKTGSCSFANLTRKELARMVIQAEEEKGMVDAVEHSITL